MRMVICLYHQEERSYQEIAEIMDLPAGTVKSHLFRGRNLLKKLLLQTIKKGEL
jgi:RNA polymerase sigma-70 factor (ECF subfamily)